MQIKILKYKKQIAVGSLILILSLVYFFSLGSRRQLAGDVLYWERETSLAKSLMSEVRSERAVIDLLKQRAEKYHRLIILAPGQDMLKLVKNYARRMNIDIINIKTNTESAHRHRWSDVVVSSRVIQTLTVEVQAECGYVNLVRYFDTLYRVAPAFLSVESLKINKDKRDPGMLKVLMELRFYSLS